MIVMQEKQMFEDTLKVELSKHVIKRGVLCAVDPSDFTGRAELMQLITSY